MINTLPDRNELSKILSYLDCNDRDTWVKAFCICGREYHQDMGVFDTLQQWSSRYPNRKPSDATHELHDFTRGSHRDGAGIGTLINMAKARGYQPPKAKKDPAPQTIFGPAVWQSKNVPVLHKLPENAAETALQLQDTTELTSRTLLKNFLFFSLSEEEQAVRGEFLARHKDQLQYYPEDVRAYFEALTVFSAQTARFSYGDFVSWLTVAMPTFNEQTLLELTDAHDPISTELYEEFFNRMFQASWRLLSAQLAKELSDKLCTTSYSRAQSAIDQFNQEVMVEANSVLKIDFMQGIESCQAIIPQIIDPAQSDKYYVSSGHSEIDRFIYGYRRGEVTLFAAHSGVGKTWFGVDTARLTLNRGKRVLFVSTEMDPDSIYLRFYCNIAGVDSPRPYQLTSPTPSAQDAALIQEKVEFYQGKRDFVIKTYESAKGNLQVMGKRTGGISIEEIEQALFISSITAPVDLVVIDYLQNIINDGFGNRTTSNYERVKNTMERLTRMCHEYSCATLALAQLNNPNRKTVANAAPNLYDIADSTYVVRDAAAVLMMYRDENDVTRLKVAKSRYGNLTEGDLTLSRLPGSQFAFYNFS